MYVPKIHAETRLDVLHGLVEAHSLGTWVAATDAGLEVNHLPFVLDRSRGEYGTLMGHISRANPIWHQKAGGAQDVVIFRGPQAYITPSWYPGKRDHGKEVPTWNYAVVSIWGQPRFMEDPQWLHDHLRSLTDIHEEGNETPWKVEDAPEDFTRKLVRAIIGVEIPIAKIEGKWKVSQNRTAPDQQGVIAGLADRGDAQDAAMARLVEQHLRA